MITTKAKSNHDNLKRTLTTTEAESAIIHAEAFIRLVASQDPDRYGLAASEWLDKYSEELFQPIPKGK